MAAIAQISHWTVVRRGLTRFTGLVSMDAHKALDNTPPPGGDRQMHHAALS
jgi:hypothetical protein